METPGNASVGVLGDTNRHPIGDYVCLVNATTRCLSIRAKAAQIALLDAERQDSMTFGFPVTPQFVS